MENRRALWRLLIAPSATADISARACRAPSAKLDDGEFDVTIWSGFGVLDFVRLRSAIRDGTHVRERGTEVARVRVATATGEARTLLELDGEAVGRLPARIEVLPAAIRLKI
jgi:diacylglycerol kinase (ATP)